MRYPCRTIHLITTITTMRMTDYSFDSIAPEDACRSGRGLSGRCVERNAQNYSHPFRAQRMLLGCALCAGLSAVALPALSNDPPPSAALQRLVNMFSPQIQTTLGACQSQGGVNLAAGATQSGTVVCANGAAVDGVAYQTYVSTASDFLAASSLVGMRAEIASNPQVTAERLVAALRSPEGTAAMQTAIESAIVRTGLVANNSPESSAVLTREVVARLLPTIESTHNLQTLLGSAQQYQQTVSRFCTAPGMSIDQAKQTLPGLSAVQLYAICVQESGLADEMLHSSR